MTNTGLGTGERRIRAALTAVAVIGALVVLAGGLTLYRGQEALLRTRAEDQIGSVGRLKVEELSRWRADRLADGRRVMNDPGLRIVLTRWLRDPEGMQTEEEAVGALSTLRFDGRYRSVVFVDTGGRGLISSAGTECEVNPAMVPVIRESMAAKDVRLTDLHVLPPSGRPHLHVVAPVLAESGAAIGAVVFEVDAEDYLFPYMQRWPTPSPTAETILARREDGRVLFLNDLRHARNPDMSLSLPLSRTEAPVVKAALGQRGIVEGVDYRGERVFAYLDEVPGSGWLVVAKMDVEDALMPWRGRSRFIVALIVALMVLFVSCVALAWQFVRSTRLARVLDAERAQRSAESRLAVTLQSVGDAVISTDAQGGIQFMNPVAEQLTGWRCEDVKGRPFDTVFRVVDEDTGEPIENLVDTIMRERVVMGLSGRTILKARDGSEYAVADSGAPILDGDGELLGAVIVFRDQTAERAAQRALADSESRFRTLVEGAPDGILVVVDGRFAYANATACELYGADSAQELIGRSVFDVVDPGQHESVRGRIVGMAEESRPVPPFDQTHVRLDGERIDVEVSAVPVALGEVTGALVFVRDVRARKALESELEIHRERLEDLVVERTAELSALNVELERATQAKTRFLANMSHELRTPLNSIIGLSALLAEGMSGPLTDDQTEQARVINRSGRHLLALISDVLDISKIEAGKATLAYTEFDPAAVLAEVVDALRPLADEKGLALNVSVPDERDTVCSDESKVRQILYNLVGNAIKFTSVGGIEVSLEVTSRMVRFVVSDSGPGIPPDERERIFEAFTQLEAGQDEGFARGTGLGLAIAMEYARLLEGTLDVSDSEAGGARFALSVPKRPTRRGRP